MVVSNSHEQQVPSFNGIPRPNTQKSKARWLWIAIGIFILLVSGCIRVPEESWTVSHRSPIEARRLTAVCTADGLEPSATKPFHPDSVLPDQPLLATGLNAGGFSLLSWNIFKGNKKGWAEDFQKLCQNTDIVVLQEAYLTDSLKKILQQGQYHWDMTAAFEYREIASGVLTATRTAPNFVCMFRETEPITRIPKSALITRYPLSGTELELLVANIHAINFTVDNSAFQKQIDRLEAILAAYQGPLIVSGDFNTWNSGRISSVKDMAQRLDLNAVNFDKNRRSLFFGHPIDHVYYRGLETENAAIPIVSSSDHNPLTVVFKLAHEPTSY